MGRGGKAYSLIYSGRLVVYNGDGLVGEYGSGLGVVVGNGLLVVTGLGESVTKE